MEGLGEGPSYVRIFSKAWVVHTLPCGRGHRAVAAGSGSQERMQVQRP
jgi:hypothetical protein